MNTQQNQDNSGLDSVGFYEDIFRNIDLIESVNSDNTLSSELDIIKAQILGILDQKDEVKTQKFKDGFINLKYKALNKKYILQTTKLKAVADVIGSSQAQVFIEKYIELIQSFLLEFEDLQRESYYNVEKSTPDLYELTDFHSGITELEKKNIGHTGLIYNLQKCIREGKFLDEIIVYVEEKMQGYDKHENFEYWDFRNIIVAAQMKEKYENQITSINATSENPQIKSFALAGGISNGIAQLGYIEEFVKGGGKISMISGSSIGALIGIFVCYGEEKDILKRIENIKGYLLNGIDGKKIDTNIIKGKEQRDITKEWFLLLAKKLGITSDVTFADTDIPFSVNAGRKYGGGEQQILLGKNSDTILDAISASSNMNGKFGTDKIDGVELTDYAVAERGNPTEIQRIVGVPDEELDIQDVGYSSRNYNSTGAIFSRFHFTRAHERDYILKLLAEREGSTVVDYDVSSSKNGGGSKFSHAIFEDLLEIGNKQYYLGLADEIEKKHDLYPVIQNISEYKGKKAKIVTQELLMRSNTHKDLGVMLDTISSEGDNFSLFCYVLQKAINIVKTTNVSTSINIYISDIMNESFIPAITAISDDNNISQKIILEILECETIPDDEDSKKTFYQKLDTARSLGFSIYLDDIGGVDPDKKLTDANYKRMESFHQKNVLDGYKMDMHSVRELFAYYKNKDTTGLDNLSTTYNIDKSEDLIVGIKNIFKNFKQDNPDLKIVAEGIEDYNLNGVDYKMNELIDFLKDLGVDYFQGFGLGKPEKVKKSRLRV